MFILVLSILMGITALYSQDPKEIINKYFEFRGYPENFDGIKSIHIKATQMQAGIAVEIEYYRYDEKVFIRSNAMGQESKAGFNGDTLWSQQAGQTQVIPKEYKDALLEQFKMLENLVLALEPKDLKEEIEFEYSGEVEENGRKACVINVISEETEAENYYYFYKDNYELFKIFAEIPTKEDNTITMETIYKDYKKDNSLNINFPYEIEMTVNDRKIKINYELIEVNIEIDKNIFKMPKN